MITELRRYRIKPGCMESWLAFFAEAAREHVRLGIRVEYAGVDPETGTFVWLRSFDDEEARVRQKAEFYGSAWWTSREAWVMDHVLDYEVTFLEATLVREDDDHLAPPWPAPGAPAGSTPDGPPEGWQRSTRATFVRTG